MAEPDLVVQPQPLTVFHQIGRADFQRVLLFVKVLEIAFYAVDENINLFALLHADNLICRTFDMALLNSCSVKGLQRKPLAP